MSKIIPRLFINDILARTNIIDLINTRVKLKKQGKNYKARCPFHYENTPSFIVSDEKQFYYCFGCNAHGNAIDFLMNYDRLEFVESIEELATIYAMEVPYEKRSTNNDKNHCQRQNLYQLMNKLSKFYQQELKKKTANLAHNYLQSRGLNNNIIKDFSIGFAPPGWDNILKLYGLSKEESYILNKSGMLVKNNHLCNYDLFRKRIMFPIRDKRGRVIAFGGRILGEGKPKYINSSETKIFRKSCHLYGIYEATTKNQTPSRLLVVEGYMDVISLAQFGINYAVASLGTITTKEHIQILYQSTDQVICCYDGDLAGRKAAWMTLKHTLPYLSDGRQMRFMFLPNGEDPDTLIRKIGKTEFENNINSAQPLSMFLFDTLMTQVDLSSPDGRAKLGTLSLPLISQIPSKIFRMCLLQRLGSKIGILDDYNLKIFLSKTVNKVNIFQKPRTKLTTMRILIGLLVQNPRLSVLVPTIHGLDQIRQAGIPLFIELVKTCQAQPKLKSGLLLEQYRNNKFYSQLETLVSWNHMIVDDMIEPTFVDTLEKLYNSILQQRQSLLIARDRTHGLTLKERKELWSLNLSLTKK